MRKPTTPRLDGELPYLETGWTVAFWTTIDDPAAEPLAACAAPKFARDTVEL